MKVVRTVFAAIALFTAVAASSASAQGVNLSGPWQCVAQCVAPLGSFAYITQYGWDLNLVNEAGVPSRAWIDRACVALAKRSIFSSSIRRDPILGFPWPASLSPDCAPTIAASRLADFTMSPLSSGCESGPYLNWNSIPLIDRFRNDGARSKHNIAAGTDFMSREL